MQEERQDDAHELSELCRARIANLVLVFEDNSAFECNLSDVEGKGEKPGLSRKGRGSRENKLDEVTGMDTKLMLPCRTPTETGPRDGITTEVNHRHVRSHLTSDPDMERGRTGSLSGGDAKGAGGLLSLRAGGEIHMLLSS